MLSRVEWKLWILEILEFPKMEVGQANLGRLTHGQPSLLGTMVLSESHPPQRQMSQHVKRSAPLNLMGMTSVQVGNVSRHYQIGEVLMPLFYTLHRLRHDLEPRREPGSRLIGSLYFFILKEIFWFSVSGVYIRAIKSVLCKLVLFKCKSSPSKTGASSFYTEVLPTAHPMSLSTASNSSSLLSISPMTQQVFMV